MTAQNTQPIGHPLQIQPNKAFTLQKAIAIYYNITMSENQLDINTKITKTVMSKIQTVFTKNFGFDIELVDLRGNSNQEITPSKSIPQYCKILHECQPTCQRCKQEKLRSLAFAFKTGQPYISICHAGLVNVCVPAMESQTPLGGLFFGKCLFEPVSDLTKQEILKPLSGLSIDTAQLLESATKLPVIPARKLHNAAEFLFVLLYETANLDPRIIHLQRSKTLQQAQISDVIHREKKKAQQQAYPYEREKELVEKVKIGDKTGVKEILNYILGKIMFSNPGKLNILKARLVELLGMLSRSAAEGGVNVEYILEKNSEYISNVISLNTQEDICVWLSEALNDFVDHVWQAQQNKKQDPLKTAIDFMERNFAQKLKLEEIANSAHLSPSRLCHIFKEQKQMTVFDYLTSLRINYAKELLLSTDYSCTKIALEVGYNYQSYFDRIFKEKVGLTPKQFQKQNKTILKKRS